MTSAYSLSKSCKPLPPNHSSGGSGFQSAPTLQSFLLVAAISVVWRSAISSHSTAHQAQPARILLGRVLPTHRWRFGSSTVRMDTKVRPGQRSANRQNCCHLEFRANNRFDPAAPSVDRPPPSPRTIRKRVNQYIHDIDIAEQLDHLRTFQLQGRWLDWFKHMHQDLSWQRLIHNWSDAELRFALQSTTDTAPTATNLRRWGVSEVDPACIMCGKLLCYAMFLMVAQLHFTKTGCWSIAKCSWFSTKLSRSFDHHGNRSFDHHGTTQKVLLKKIVSKSEKKTWTSSEICEKNWGICYQLRVRGCLCEICNVK